MHLGTDVGPLGTYEESKDSKFDPLTLWYLMYKR